MIHGQFYNIVLSADGELRTLARIPISHLGDIKPIVNVNDQGDTMMMIPVGPEQDRDLMAIISKFISTLPRE